MEKNRMLYTQKIQEAYFRGLPDGLSEDLIRQIPVLFERIKELELALVPFARAHDVNKQFGKELTEVYMKDCLTAKKMIDPRYAHPLPGKQYEYPAE